MLCRFLPCLLLLMCSETAFGDLIDFSNATPITINDKAIADPYPSAIVVSGIVGSLNNLTVTLSGLNHTFPDDLAAVIVSPSKTAVLLFSGPGDFNDAVNLDLVFDDNASAALRNSGILTSGTYKPGQEQWDDYFPAPGPLGKVLDTDPAPWSFNFRPLLAESPNGIWSLYVLDNNAVDVGSISRGWSISFDVTAVPEPTSGSLIVLLALGGLFHRGKRNNASQL